MARPKQEQPTPGELEVLKVLWEIGPATVRQVMDRLNEQTHPRAYTSVMSLLNVMTDKRLVRRRTRGRAFAYEATAEQKQTLGCLLGDLLGRAFSGSTTALVTQLLDQSNPTAAELEEIRRLLDNYPAQDDAP
ncbi:BlaI/MecI/CopY family transcriptional regulator [Lignipirellula cremea]|uniref:Penicillinase repressor n=1 Tax=Lignipirellula cremea TaxID=2528010 RepID=A0A518DZD3_9BACT|nr:BlaI/MecI/CopY family transcriptional regulator [Lignipirellula cremea]QDU97207.1 Penicillinase repressor [Lignipirellula cremea]